MLALCTGKPKSGALPTSADKHSLTSKPEGQGHVLRLVMEGRAELFGMGYVLG